MSAEEVADDVLRRASFPEARLIEAIALTTNRTNAQVLARWHHYHPEATS